MCEGAGQQQAAIGERREHAGNVAHAAPRVHAAQRAPAARQGRDFVVALQIARIVILILVGDIGTYDVQVRRLRKTNVRTPICEGVKDE